MTDTASIRAEPERQPGLRRTLTMTNLVLYGLGVTIGAGIYVLVGAAAGRAGMHAPLAFVAAAALMALSALSFAELASRMPIAASEAAYVRAGFRSDLLATTIGLMVIAMAVVSAAAIASGSAGYIGVFVPLPRPVIVGLVVVAMGAVAAWGIKESVVFAGVMTMIEIGGLMVLVLAGVIWEPATFARLPEMLPPSGGVAPWFGILSAGLLAVFAFVGFEGIVNVAEEVERPQKTIPAAILLTLLIATLLYVSVVWIALVTVGPERLANSDAPLALVFERLTGASPALMAAIAIVATLNGVIVQMIMGSRVAYGLGGQGALPAWLARVNPVTQTPVLATVAVIALTLTFALLLPLDRLADMTSRLALVLFAFVNAALVLIKWREEAVPEDAFVAPMWVPMAGTISTLGFLAADLVMAS